MNTIHSSFYTLILAILFFAGTIMNHTWAKSAEEIKEILHKVDSAIDGIEIKATMTSIHHEIPSLKASINPRGEIF